MNNPSHRISIPIERRFYKGDKYEDAPIDPEQQRILGEFYESQTLGWDDILPQKRVVILGEAKCGKTHEFKQQVEMLRDRNEMAFFIPLESLGSNDLEYAITHEDEILLDEWTKESSSREAWFFLDAVDELRLKDGDFRIALRKLQRAIKDKIHYSHVLVSCRPADWNHQIDIDSLKSIFPHAGNEELETNKSGGQPLLEKSLEENFINTVEQWYSHDGFSDKKASDGRIKSKEAFNDTPSVYALLPLSPRSIVEFASKHDSSKAEGLKEKLDHGHIWHLFQTPADIIDGLSTINKPNWINSLGDHISDSIDVRLQERSSFGKGTLLSLDKAREGAECLALALMLTKKRSLHLRKSSDGDKDLSVQGILTDWTLDEQKELLSRGLFDLSGMGTIRFHHSSDYEFLAARRLLNKKEEGMRIRDIKQRLFAETWHEKVVIPSMGPVTAWLALWNEDILSEIKKRKPEILFQQSIPASMPIPMRKDILRYFVHAYKESDEHRINVPHSDVKRLGHEDLGSVVRELWVEAYTGHDTRELMLELIWQTPLPGCTDLALKAAFDNDLPDHHRSFACLSVLKSGNSKEKSSIGQALVCGGWPERVVRAAIPHLFPDVLLKDELVQLAKDARGNRNSIHDISYYLCSLVHRLDSVEHIRDIRTSLAKEVWESRSADSYFSYGHSPFSYFVNAILLGCARDDDLNTAEERDNWIWNAVVAMHFDDKLRPVGEQKHVKEIIERIREDVKLRESYLWAELKMHIEFKGAGVADRFFRLDQHNILLGSLSEEDVSWLLKALSDKSNVERRYVAFDAIMSIWKEKKDSDLAKKVRKAIVGLPNLIPMYDRYLNPPRVSSSQELDNRRAREKEKKEREKQIAVEEWRRWYQSIETDVENAFSGERKSNTLNKFLEWLNDCRQPMSSWGSWQNEQVRQCFSDQFVELLLPELSSYWRNSAPQLWSEKETGSRNSVQLEELYALSAIKSEAEDTEWTGKLSSSEIRLATRLSAIDLNGFAFFYPELENGNCKIVHEVLLGELDGQISQIHISKEVPMVREVYYYGTDALKKAIARRLLNTLHLWPIETDLQYVFGYAVNLIVQNVSFENRRDIVKRIEDRFDNISRDSDECVYLLCALTALDVSLGCNKIIELTDTDAPCYDHNFSMKVFGDIFGRRPEDGWAQPNIPKLDLPQQLDLLVCLVRRSHEVARPSDDIQHEGVYTRGVRDYAEAARNSLLGALVNLKSIEAYRAIEEFEKLPAFSDVKDYLRQHRLYMAEYGSEHKAMSEREFLSFDNDHIVHPIDNEAMHRLMTNRLDDYEHYINESEYSNRSALIKMNGEKEFRREISRWLNDNSCKAYKVSQEAVTKDEKQPDISLISTVSDIQSAIELKIDGKPNRWTASELENALRNQLIKQYLGHNSCQSGFFLIVMLKKRNWENPYTKKRMSLSETVEWLREIANEVANKSLKPLVTVKGIDLTTD